MLVTCPSEPLATLRGTQHSPRNQMRSPSTQTNSSSSSLESMGKPVRSFKSFIKTVPPNPPAHSKPLTPVSAPAVTSSPPPSPLSTRSSIGRSTSIIPWKPPTDWFDGAPNRKDSIQPLAISTTRTYSPLIPEPSPDSSDMTMEVRMAQLSSASPQEKLLPIYERPNLSDLGPPRTPPPKSPLPSPPLSSPRAEKQPPLVPPRSPSRKRPQTIPGCPPLQTELPYRTVSSATSVTHNDSSVSTKEHLLTLSRIDSPREVTPTLENKYDESPSSLSPDPTRRDHSYHRGGGKPRAPSKSNLFNEDSGEETVMNDKERQMSFSQDYHDLLADQYQEMSVSSEEVVRNGAPVYGQADHSRNIQVPERPQRDDEVAPTFSWDKSSTTTSVRSNTREMEGAEELVKNNEFSTAKVKRRRSTIASWVPHRLRIGPKPQESRRRHSEPPSASEQKQLPDSDVDKEIKKDFRLTTIFPPSKLKSAKKSKDMNGTTTAKAAPSPVSPKHSPVPFIRLSGGLAVIRAKPSHSNTPAHPSSTTTSSNRRHSSEQTSSVYDASDRNDPSPASASYPSDKSHPSHTSHISRPVTPVASTIATIKLPSLFASWRSGISSSHPVAQDVIPPPPPPTSSHDPYTHTRTRSENSTQQTLSGTGSMWRKFRGTDDEQWHKLGFLEKAREVRRRRARDARRDKLKKSIKILGPTDPWVVQQPHSNGDTDRTDWVGGGKWGRKPGYLVGT